MRDPDAGGRFRVRARGRRAPASANADGAGTAGARSDCRRQRWQSAFFRVEVNGASLRFMVMRKPDGSWGTALDACMICGWAGYQQDGSNMVCRNCGSAIYVPTIGQPGGCNPVALPSQVRRTGLGDGPFGAWPTRRATFRTERLRRASCFCASSKIPSRASRAASS